MMRKRAQKNKKKSFIQVFFEYVFFLVPIIIVSLLLQNFVVSTFKVSGDSMSPTLQHDQSMMMYKLATPNRFDVVVVESPDEVYERDENGEIKKDFFGNPVRRLYIKRVIGMPGDTLEYRNNELYINGEKYEEPYLNAYRRQIVGQYMADSTLEEYMTYARSVIPTLPQENTTLVEKNGVKVIPEGFYFVLGDNRIYSRDSQEYGLVNKKLIKGVVILRFYPFDKISIAPFNE